MLRGESGTDVKTAKSSRSNPAKTETDIRSGLLCQSRIFRGESGTDGKQKKNRIKQKKLAQKR